MKIIYFKGFLGSEVKIKQKFRFYMAQYLVTEAVAHLLWSKSC